MDSVGNCVWSTLDGEGATLSLVIYLSRTTHYFYRYTKLSSIQTSLGEKALVVGAAATNDVGKGNGAFNTAA